jgi:hypothetical protein
MPSPRTVSRFLHPSCCRSIDRRLLVFFFGWIGGFQTLT